VPEEIEEQVRQVGTAAHTGVACIAQMQFFVVDRNSVPTCLQIYSYGTTEPSKIVHAMHINSVRGAGGMGRLAVAGGTSSPLLDGESNLAEVRKIVSRIKRKDSWHSSDVQAVEMLVQQLKQEDDTCVLYYHPQVLDADRNVIQHFRLCIFHPFGQRMLRSFHEMPHLDATHGLNTLGFPQLTMLVQDEFGNGVPVAFCIASAETSEIIKEFVGGVAQVRLKRCACLPIFFPLLVFFFS